MDKIKGKMADNIKSKYDLALQGDITDILNVGLLNLVTSRKKIVLNRKLFEDQLEDEAIKNQNITRYFHDFVAEQPEPEAKEDKKKGKEYLEVRGIKTRQLLNPFTIPNIVQIAISYNIDIRFWHYG